MDYLDKGLYNYRNMSKQKWFRREIIERFMDKKELEEFEIRYFKARILNIGKEKLGKSPFLF